MTFGAVESSRFLGQPIDLYEFRFGAETESVARYTNIEAGFTYAGEDYTPLPIARGNLVSSGTLDRTTLQMTLPETSDIARLYDQETPSSVITVVVRQGHVPDGDFKVVFSGRVLNGAFDEQHQIVLDCEPISSSMRRAGLTRDYQYACPHVLYGPQCRASREAATRSVTALSVNGPRVTFSPTWDTDARRPKYLGGIAEWTGSDGRLARRSIVSVEAGGVVVLSSDADTLTSGASVSMVLGCNHQHGMTDPDGDCLNLHDNIVNYGGQHEIPLKNPIGITNNFY